MGNSTISMAMFNSYVKLPESSFFSYGFIGNHFLVIEWGYWNEWDMYITNLIYDMLVCESAGSSTNLWHFGLVKINDG